MSESPPVTEAEIQAYADGRLAEERRPAVEAWLAARPEEAQSVAAYRRVREGLRAAYGAVLAEPVPPHLERAARRGTRWNRFALAAALLALGVAVGAVAGWQLHASRLASAEVDSMVRRAALAHATYSAEVRHPVEVAASQEAHLVAWLSKRLGMKVSAPNLNAAGMALVGGRLLPGETRPAAWLMYENRDGRRVTLYWAPETTGNVELRYARETNVSMFYWIDEECGYALASADLNQDELRRVAVLAYEQLEK